MKKLKINKVNAQQFKNYISKLSSITSSLYLNLSSEYVYSNIHNENKTVVKLHRIPTNEIFELDKSIDFEIKMCFFDGNKVNKSLGYLDSENIEGEIEYDYDKESEEYLAEKFRIKDGKISITLECSDPSVGFTDIPKDKIKDILNTQTKMYSFDMMSMDIPQIKSLNDLDQENQFKIYSDGSGVHAKSVSYDTVLDEEPKEEYPERLIKKNHIQSLDQETYTVTACDSKIIFESQDHDTKIVIIFAKSAE